METSAASKEAMAATSMALAPRGIEENHTVEGPNQETLNCVCMCVCVYVCVCVCVSPLPPPLSHPHPPSLHGALAPKGIEGNHTVERTN